MILYMLYGAAIFTRAIPTYGVLLYSMITVSVWNVNSEVLRLVRVHSFMWLSKS